MKHLNIFLLALAPFFFTKKTVAQGSYFGLKGGLTMGTQKWNTYDRDPLFKYHGAAFIESLEETGQYSVFAQLGYHVKGSALRYNTGSFFGNNYRPPADQFVFNNISLIVGMKKKYEMTPSSKYYYLFGLRGDYTVSNNLSDFEEDTFNPGFYPLEGFVNPWIFGITVGGGLDLDFGEFVGGFLEFTVNPDVSYQYKQPSIGNVPDPFRPGQTRTIRERSIRNLTFEVTLGIRFLREVIYID